MSKMSRRSFLKSQVPIPASTAHAGGPSGATVDEGASRRAFLQGAGGAAAGAALVLVTPKVAAVALDASGGGPAAEPRAVVTKPSGPAPREPVTAYVRNAERGEVTVMSGKQETTYRDHVLVKRLLDAAH
jgi:hypothetical protein